MLLVDFGMGVKVLSFLVSLSCLPCSLILAETSSVRDRLPSINVLF